MSYDNQGYSSGNQSSPDNDQADNGLEATTHRTSVFGEAQQGYGGQDDTQLSMPAGSPPSSYTSASYPSSQSSAGYSAQAGWGQPQQASDQAWATQHHAPGHAWGTHHQAPDQAWGGQQTAADQAWAQQQAPDQAWGTHHQAPQQAWNAPQQQPPADDNVVTALTDFSFTKMATPGLVKILYIAAGILGILQLLGFTFSAFTLGSQLGTFGIVLGVLGLIGGLVGLLVFVLAVRIYLELALSVVRTSQDVRHLRNKFDETD